MHIGFICLLFVCEVIAESRIEIRIKYAKSIAEFCATKPCGWYIHIIWETDTYSYDLVREINREIDKIEYQCYTVDVVVLER